MPDEGQFVVVITGIAFGAGLVLGVLLCGLGILVFKVWWTKEPSDL